MAQNSKILEDYRHRQIKCKICNTINAKYLKFIINSLLKFLLTYSQNTL